VPVRRHAHDYNAPYSNACTSYEVLSNVRVSGVSPILCISGLYPYIPIPYFHQQNGPSALQVILSCFSRLMLLNESINKMNASTQMFTLFDYSTSFVVYGETGYLTDLLISFRTVHIILMERMRHIFMKSYLSGFDGMFSLTGPTP
jgi:hypothetical protein